MGAYLNPGNGGFVEMLESGYIDKTEMIGQINRTIGTTNKLTCISRPRRFGKSFAAKMLCSYYDKSCDSSALFSGLKIASDETYREHLNRYDVIYLDMTNIMGKTTADQMIPFIEESVTGELLREYPKLTAGRTFDETLINTVRMTGNQFIMIIDEWDAPIRELPETEKKYLNFLRMLFKSSGTTAQIFAAAYMTGILPIKKDGSQSAISDFQEYTMLKPRKYAPYVGFTEAEVEGLCAEYDVDFTEMRRWYDGYSFPGVSSVYNPNSVMQAVRNGEFESYWKQTSAADSLKRYITMDFAGLSKTIAELIGGVDVKVETGNFANDLVTFSDADDVLTLMIHLGYLAYDSMTGTARIPNEEIRLEFQNIIRRTNHAETARRLQESDQLFYDTIHGNQDAVAAQIEKVHMEETSPLHYNREDSLRSVVKLAYYTYRDHYLMWEELPAGMGYADIVYLPKQGEGVPALVVELKWNDSAEGAIAQIENRKYPEALKGYGGEILLVGIDYDKETKKHCCRIRKVNEGSW